MELVLASKSSRRKKLLGKIAKKFRAISPVGAEEFARGRKPSQTAKARAISKASEVAAIFPKALVVGADTIVVLGQRQYGKPKNAKQAREMLLAFSGKNVRVVTAIAIVCNERDIGLSWAEWSRVKFSVIGEKALGNYIRSRKWKGKAGGFNIQEYPARKWAKVIGDRDIVAGLGLLKLKKLLGHFNAIA